MAELHLIEGPAGSGKSQLAREMKAAGSIAVLADTTALWAAVGVYDRLLSGTYPVRQPDDPALSLALYLQATIAHYALRNNLNVGVTTSQRDQAERWRQIAEQENATFRLTTVDPGERVVRARLANPVTEVLSSECEQAIARWYG